MCRASWRSLPTWRYSATHCSWTWFQTRGWRRHTRRCTAWRRGTPTCCCEYENSSRGSQTSNCRRPSGSAVSSTPSHSSLPSCSRSVCRSPTFGLLSCMQWLVLGLAATCRQLMGVGWGRGVWLLILWQRLVRLISSPRGWHSSLARNYFMIFKI